MFKNIGSNWVLNVLQILVLMQLTPFVLHALGTETNGVWITIVSLTGFLRLLVLGIPMASVRFIAEHAARKDTQRTNQAISTCLGITLSLGLAALAVGGLLYLVFDRGYLEGAGWSELVQRDEARLAFGVVVLQVAAGFATRLPYGILDAHHDFVRRNVVMAGELLLRLGLTVGLLSWRPSLVLLALVQVICMSLEFLVAWGWAVRRHGVRFGLGSFDRTMVGAILSFSVFAMLLNVGNLLAFRTDALVIGAWLEAAEVTNFDMGNKFFEPLTGFVIAIGAVVMPMATRLKAAGTTDELKSMLLKWSKIAASLVLCVGVYLLVLGPEFLGWWIGPEFVGPSGRVLQVLMVSFLFYLPVRGVALPILMGLGLPKGPAGALLVMGLINLALSIALVKPLGILGVALGTALPNVLFAGTVLVMACREIETGVGEYLMHVAVKPLLGALAPAALLLAWKASFGVEGLVELVAAGLASVALFAVVWIFFVYRGDPHVDLLARVKALAGRPGPGDDPR